MAQTAKQNSAAQNCSRKITVKRWNKLPQVVMEALSEIVFKHGLEQHWTAIDVFSWRPTRLLNLKYQVSNKRPSPKQAGNAKTKHAAPWARKVPNVSECMVASGDTFRVQLYLHWPLYYEFTGSNNSESRPAFG